MEKQWLKPNFMGISHKTIRPSSPPPHNFCLPLPPSPLHPNIYVLPLKPQTISEVYISNKAHTYFIHFVENCRLWYFKASNKTDCF